MDYIKSLQELGFSPNESTVYLSLLGHGLTNVGPVVKETKLHRQLVYEALEKLIERKLASVKIKNNRKHFQAASPTQIIRQLEEKQNLGKRIVPDLIKLQAQAEDRVEVRTLYGKGGFFENLKDVVASAARTDKILRIIGGARDIDFYHTIGPHYQEYVDILQQAKVKKYLIAPEAFSNEFKEKFAAEKGNKLKTMELGLSSPTYTRITPEMTTIEIYSTDITVIQIYSKAAAKGYLEHFKLLWNQAAPYGKSSRK